MLNVGSPLSCPAVLTASPTLINFISLSFFLMSGNSFPTHTEPQHIFNLKAFTQLEANPATRLQRQGANSRNRTIRIIEIRIVFHHEKNIS